MFTTDHRRWFAMGDPQTSFAKITAILRGHGLMGDGGRLRDDVGLVSIGDHFDFQLHDGRTLAESARDGVDTLRWLAGHPSDQVVIIIGNHDTSRVMELAFETDASFAAARALAAMAVSEDPPGDKTREFLATYPRIARPGLAHRDFSAFEVDQRELVQELLLAGRLRLACLGQHGGTPILITHAGVTAREVELLGVEPRADALADALEGRLRDAVTRVRGAWARKENAALDLEPLHFAAQRGREGGGLLYHRPSSKPDDTGDHAPIAPRRFDPSELPRGLVQVCGHSGHHKSLKELAQWVRPSAAARARGGLRTLRASQERIDYEGGVLPARRGDATMYFIDIEMNSPEVSDYPLFELESVVTTVTAA